MRRKIFRLGASTLVTSLPAKWVKQHNLKPGDELLTFEKEKSITFSTMKDLEMKEVEIDIEELNQELIKEYLSGAYIRGYDKIKILFKKQESLVFTQETINSLIGLAIIEQGTNFCVAGEITETTDTQFENIFRRIFLLTISMAEDSLIDLIKNDKEALKGIKRRDLDIDIFINFCFRVLNKKGYKEYLKTPIVYNILQVIKELGNNYGDLTVDLIRHEKITFRKELEELYKEINESVKKFYHLFYNFKKGDLISFQRECWERNEKIKSLNNLKNINPEEMTLLYHLRKINDNLYNLFKLKINEHF
ncbi:MAG: phosphate uptake regulator PhoU [Nanoarchaeota archaeon]|nr:phosphate uptake regulator PhoU [Nanoarchaeota archaeon]MBU1622244.1 phosphate uptake regulator PhoU [Nanoarchaeota archaeon]